MNHWRSLLRKLPLGNTTVESATGLDRISICRETYPKKANILPGDSLHLSSYFVLPVGIMVLLLKMVGNFPRKCTQ